MKTKLETGYSIETEAATLTRNMVGLVTAHEVLAAPASQRYADHRSEWFGYAGAWFERWEPLGGSWDIRLYQSRSAGLPYGHVRHGADGSGSIVTMHGLVRWRGVNFASSIQRGWVAAAIAQALDATTGAEDRPKTAAPLTGDWDGE